jgi:radical SAM superfamily enzyme YgiQ (UPF0313 family)
MKRRVVLINPKVCSPRSTRFPLSLLALAAVLEDRWQLDVVDGNFEADPAARVRALLDQDDVALVGVTVMPGPQVAPAIAVSTMVRRHAPRVPIAWGGYFPTLYPDAAINAPYVDFVVRGQGEDTLLELLDRLDHDAGDGRRPADGLPASPGDARALAEVRGLTFRRAGEIVHNPDRPFRPPDTYPLYPYRRLPGATAYPRPSFLGARTVAHQAAIGCRFRCNFCGVVSMFNGYTDLQGPDRLDATLTTLRDEYAADSVQYYDHNFFDREDSSVATLEVLARHRLPWWCFARTDTLANFSPGTWKLIEKSGLRMTYLGAEAASDDVLRTMKKGTKVEHTIAAARRCQEHGVIPELSFILGGPEDPEGEIERTFAFIRRLKAMVPACEIVLYFYSPTPQRDRASRARDHDGARIPVLDTYGPGGEALPTTPEEWTERRWVDYTCHLDAPWLTPALRRRVQDFSKVLACRFPTVQDYHTPSWGKTMLKSLAGWRYATGWYGKPWELDVARRLVRLREPQRESL